MNRDEVAVATWLRSNGHSVRHLSNGNDPPDLVVDGDVAVEVTTIASYAHRTLWDFMDGVCKSLGPAEDGRGYWLEVVSDNEVLLQDKDKVRVAAIKRDLKRCAKATLRDHYTTSLASVAAVEYAAGRHRHGHFALPHGVELRIWGPINNNREDVKYKVGAGGAKGGGLVLPDLIDAIQAAIGNKTAKPTIQERVAQYAEWWLVVTDPHRHAEGLNDSELRAVANAVQYGAPWRRLLLVDLASDKVSRVVDLTKPGAW